MLQTWPLRELLPKPPHCYGVVESRISWVILAHMNRGPGTYPILAVTVPGADDGPCLLNHLQDGPSMNIASHVGIIWPHDPTAGKRNGISLFKRTLL